MGKTLIELKDLTKSYGNNTVVNRVNLTIRENEFVTLLGCRATASASVAASGGP